MELVATYLSIINTPSPIFLLGLGSKNNKGVFWMKRIKLIGVIVTIMVTGGFLAGCSDGDNPPTFEEQGYSIVDIETFGSNANVVYLTKDGVSYVGTVNDKMEWLMEPTDEYQELTFHEGLAAVAVPEERDIILVQDSGAENWGFIDIHGKWVVQPIYRDVNDFSDGVAIVETIEEDRDDFGNSRIITIDTEGKEIGEIISSYLAEDGVDQDLLPEAYFGGYAYTPRGFYDKKGNFTEMEASTDHYIAVGGNIFQNGDYENPGIQLSNIKGENKGIFKNEDESINVYNYEELDAYTTKGLSTNNVALVKSENQSYLIDSSNLSILLRGNVTTGLGEGLLFIEERDNLEDDEVARAKDGSFYDMNGKKVGTVKGMVGPLIGDRYFKQEKEYYTLVDLDGNILIDESAKITYVEVAEIDEFDEVINPYKNVTSIDYRRDADDIVQEEGLLNIKDLEITSYEDILKQSKLSE